jgi:hypothetical protein
VVPNILKEKPTILKGSKSILHEPLTTADKDAFCKMSGTMYPVMSKII